MPNHRGLTGDLELPDWPDNYDLKTQDGELDMLTVFTGEVIDAYQCGQIRVVDCIDVKSSAFAMVCAMLWHLEYCGYDETPPAEYRARCSKNATGWTRETAARLEAERKVG